MKIKPEINEKDIKFYVRKYETHKSPRRNYLKGTAKKNIFQHKIVSNDK